jgi:hypothetical protein
MATYVETVKPHTYAGKRRNTGDQYKVKDQSHFRLAVSLGWVKRVAPPVVVAPVVVAQPSYQTRAMNAEPPRAYVFEQPEPVESEPVESEPAETESDETEPVDDNAETPRVKRKYTRRVKADE